MDNQALNDLIQSTESFAKSFMEMNIFEQLFILSLPVSFIFRKTFIGGSIWEYWKLFLLFILVSLGIDYGKDKIKDWWNN